MLHLVDSWRLDNAGLSILYEQQPTSETEKEEIQFANFDFLEIRKVFDAIATETVDVTRTTTRRRRKTTRKKTIVTSNVSITITNRNRSTAITRAVTGTGTGTTVRRTLIPRRVPKGLQTRDTPSPRDPITATLSGRLRATSMPTRTSVIYLLRAHIYCTIFVPSCSCCCNDL